MAAKLVSAMVDTICHDCDRPPGLYPEAVIDSRRCVGTDSRYDTPVTQQCAPCCLPAYLANLSSWTWKLHPKLLSMGSLEPRCSNLPFIESLSVVSWTTGEQGDHIFCSRAVDQLVVSTEFCLASRAAREASNPWSYLQNKKSIDQGMAPTSTSSNLMHERWNLRQCLPLS